VTSFRLDPAARARVQVACNFVNEQIGEQRRNVMFVGIGIAIVAIPLLAAYPNSAREILYAALFCVLAMYGYARHQVAKSYKQLVVGRVVKALGDGLTYKAESSFDAKRFRALELFADTPSSFTSEDEIGGRKANVSYSIHEVRATRRQGKQTVTVFHGLMVRLDFNKNFRGRTTVVPNGAGNAGGSLLAQLFQVGGSPRKEKVTLENPDFENIFDVHSTNDQEARYLLTPKLMELVLAANAANSDGTLRLSFLDNSLYVAVPSRGNHLEASLSETVTPDSAIGDLAEVIAFAERLVDELQLETRIWSRA
jgi:hypothetical protein